MSRVPNIKPKTTPDISAEAEPDLEQDRAQDRARETMRRPYEKRSPLDFIFSSPRRMKIFLYGFILVVAMVVLLRMSFMYKLAVMMP